MEGEHHQNGVIDQGKSRKRYMNRKWTERNYHVQDNADVELKYVKMYCNTNQFPTLPFCGSHSKPHSARGTRKIKKKIHEKKMDRKKVSCSG